MRGHRRRRRCGAGVRDHHRIIPDHRAPPVPPRRLAPPESRAGPALVPACALPALPAPCLRCLRATCCHPAARHPPGSTGAPPTIASRGAECSHGLTTGALRCYDTDATEDPPRCVDVIDRPRRSSPSSAAFPLRGAACAGCARGPLRRRPHRPATVGARPRITPTQFTPTQFTQTQFTPTERRPTRRRPTRRPANRSARRPSRPVSAAQLPVSGAWRPFPTPSRFPGTVRQPRPRRRGEAGRYSPRP